jgi:hypothetical protein
MESFAVLFTLSSAIETALYDMQIDNPLLLILSPFFNALLMLNTLTNNSRNILNFAEGNVHSRSINLKEATFNLSCCHAFVVTHYDTLIDFFNSEQALYQIAIISTGSTITNPNIFRKLLILGRSCKVCVLRVIVFLLMITVIVANGLTIVVSGFLLL